MDTGIRQLYFIDDDKKFVNEFSDYIQLILNQKHINYKIYFDLMHKEKSDGEIYSWYFLDIEMPEKDGFTLAKEIYRFDRKAKIIFISNFESYVYDSYDYHAIKYILKNNYKNQINNLIDRILFEESCKYSFSYYDTSISIPIHNILYVEKHINSVEITTPKNKFIQSTTLKNIFNGLNEIIPDTFAYINKSQLVNMEKIKKYDTNIIVVENNDTLYISRKYLKEFKLKYYQYMAEFL